MEQLKNLFAMLSERLRGLATGNAVVAKPISVGNQHIIPLCELALAFGGGGGSGEESKTEGGEQPGKGTGGGSFGAAKASPVAVIVIDNGRVRIETFGH